MDYYDLDTSKTFLVTQKALIMQSGRFLLLKSAYGDTLWELPGGLLEMHEPLAMGLKREIREEAGLEISIGQPIATYDIWVNGFIFKNGSVLDARIFGVIYLCTIASGDIQLSHEHTAFTWADRSALGELSIAPGILESLTDYFNVHGYPG